MPRRKISRNELDTTIRAANRRERSLGDRQTLAFDTPEQNRNDAYTVSWICAISTEYVAAQAFLDQRHGQPQYVAPNDNNDYTLGSIGKHHVVIASSPDGEYGTNSPATVIGNMPCSFPNIRIGLIVGISSGAPSQKHDVRLGDIVVSSPRVGKSGVFWYDFEKTLRDQMFQDTRYMNQPLALLQTAIYGLRAQYESEGHQLEAAINSLLEKKPRLQKKYRPPDPSNDKLYRSEITQIPSKTTSYDAAYDEDISNLVARHERSKDEDNPAIHYGLVATGSQLIQDALVRDKLAAERDILCFDVEVADLITRLPFLVIRGICDYSDSHKSEEWHGYAALTSAAYAKDLLCRISPHKIQSETRIPNHITEIQNSINKICSTITSSSPLCQLCKEFNLDQSFKARSLPERLHGKPRQHSSYSALCKSAGRGCQLCSAIRDNQLPWFPKLEEMFDYDLMSTQIYYESREIHGSPSFRLMEWTQSDLYPVETQKFICKLVSYLSTFTTKDDQLANIVKSRPISLDSSSSSSFDIMSRWLSRCRLEHPKCRADIKANLPTRVIDVGNTESSEPKLVETEGCRGEWVALSHCWGETKPATTTLQTLGQHYRSLPMSALGRTFQDAISITRRLGFRYLWIDSLCIIQDSKEDWIAESLKMSNVYGFSALTIAAEVAPDSDSGIFASTNCFRKQITVYPFTAQAYSEKFGVEGRLHFRSRLSRPVDTTQNLLSSRAWTLQEDVLAPRVLRFAEQQMYWRCTESHLNEESPDDAGHHGMWQSRSGHQEIYRLANGADLNEISTSACLELWYALVNNFAGRKISVYTDRLLAIAAIAKKVATKIEQSYMAGIWAQDLHNGLLWSSEGSGTYRPSDYIAPSWSWAALEFSRTLQHRTSGRDVYQRLFFQTHQQGWDAEIVDIHIQNINSDPFSQVQSGYIRVRGQCLEICQCRIPDHMYDCHTIDHISKTDQILKSATTNDRGSLRECIHRSSTGHSGLFLLQIGAWDTSPMLVKELQGVKVHGLILRRINPAKDEYLRVGKVMIPRSDALLSETWSTLSVVIL